jgi:hypothetical protein
MIAARYRGKSILSPMVGDPEVVGVHSIAGTVNVRIAFSSQDCPRAWQCASRLIGAFFLVHAASLRKSMVSGIAQTWRAPTLLFTQHIRWIDAQRAAHRASNRQRAAEQDGECDRRKDNWILCRRLKDDERKYPARGHTQQQPGH